MKYCPSCQTEYADDQLQFCLQDGTVLLDARNADTESETLVIPKQVEPIRFEPPSAYQTNQTNWQPSEPVVYSQEKKKPNTPMVVVLSVLGTILLLGLGGLGAWLYLKNSRNEVVSVNVNKTTNRPTNSNAATNQNSNSNLAAASPTATPTAQPALKPEEFKAVTNDVKDALNDWKDATEDFDFEKHIGSYADTVDYYNGGRVSVAKIRADRQKAFEIYDSMDVDIDNLKVTPDASGEKATAVFDKKWNFEGEENFSSGKVQQQLQLEKINGRWLITSEKELKVYYVDK